MTLNDWIMEWKAKGYWCSPCASCGTWFAQLHVTRRGRRAVICKLKRCEAWRRYQNRNGRAPPAWLVMRMRERFGDQPRTSKPKPYEEPRCEVA